MRKASHDFTQNTSMPLALSFPNKACGAGTEISTVSEDLLASGQHPFSIWLVSSLRWSQNYFMLSLWVREMRSCLQATFRRRVKQRLKQVNSTLELPGLHMAEPCDRTLPTVTKMRKRSGTTFAKAFRRNLHPCVYKE